MRRAYDYWQNQPGCYLTQAKRNRTAIYEQTSKSRHGHSNRQPQSNTLRQKTPLPTEQITEAHQAMGSNFRVSNTAFQTPCCKSHSDSNLNQKSQQTHMKNQSHRGLMPLVTEIFHIVSAGGAPLSLLVLFCPTTSCVVEQEQTAIPEQVG